MRDGGEENNEPATRWCCEQYFEIQSNGLVMLHLFLLPSFLPSFLAAFPSFLPSFVHSSSLREL